MNTKLKYLFLSVSIIALGACNTVPTSSSSSTSTSSGSSSSGGSSSGGISSPSGSNGSSAGTSSGNTSSGTGIQQAGSQGSAQQSGSASAGAEGSYEAGSKSDDEILADALGELERGAQQKAQGADESGQNTSLAGGQAGGAKTEAEKTGELDRQLNEKFAKFDDLMLNEREDVARGDNEGGSGSGAYGNGGGDSDGIYDGSDDGPLQTAMTDESGPQGTAFGKSNRPGDSVSTAPPPADVGSGQDDDIIARQLREAAQKEQDPELRAKLWDEYRKYKKGSS